MCTAETVTHEPATGGNGVDHKGVTLQRQKQALSQTGFHIACLASSKENHIPNFNTLTVSQNPRT